MNIYSITFQTFLNTFRHQWKRVLISVLLFAMLGAAAGVFFQGRGMAEAGGGTQPLEPVDFSKAARTQDYYANCLQLLTDTMYNLNAYFSSLDANIGADLKKQDVPDSPKTPETLKALETLEVLDALSRETAVLQSTRLKPLESALGEAGAIYTPEEYLKGMADRYTRELATLRMDLISAEAATETVRQMDAPDYDGGYSGSYATLLSLAAQYPTLLRTQAITEQYLDKLTNHMPEILAECHRVEGELEAAAEELNALLDRFIPLADELAREAGLTFTPTGTSGRVDITVTHAHRASSNQESFAVIVIFFVLVGLCLGVFFAVCREAKAEKCCFSGQTEAQSPDTSP